MATNSKLNIVFAFKLVVIFAVLCELEAGTGKTIIEIKLKKFDSEGNDEAGDRCDPTWWLGNEPKCDPQFIFCVDKYSGNNDIDDCKYYRKKTDHYNNEDVVNFGSNIKGMPNPIEISVKDYEGIRFKVDADDVDDANGDDDIDKFDWRYRPVPDKSAAVADRKEVDIRGKRSGNEADLDFYIWVYCDENSYGEDCGVYCEPVDQAGVAHYGCDPDTGAIYCLDGWEDLATNCLIELNNCEPFSCANGGSCIDEYNSFRCRCLPGFTGDSCEININDCFSRPCQNGGLCTDGANRYICDCTHFYTGKQCQHHTCDHPNDYCLNGGTCYEQDDTNVACSCLHQYVGIHCDVEACQVLNCDHGECRDGVCECDPHFVGGLCDIKECEQTPCQAGGTCLDNGQCQCQHGYSGEFCETVLPRCQSQPCMNGAVCEDIDDGTNFVCQCEPGFVGALCQHRLYACDVPSNMCLNGGTCYEQDINTTTCACPVQYTGPRCDAHTCEVLHCGIHGHCLGGVCDCDVNFIGDLCIIRRCEQFPCQSGGTCLDNGECACRVGYTGTVCENVVLACNSNPCLNNAECVESASGYMCRCEHGYSGALCEYEITTVKPYGGDGQIGDQPHSLNKENNGMLPAWGLGLIIVVLVLCLITGLAITFLLKYRRKYKNNAYTVQSSVNSLYDISGVTYATGASGVTVNMDLKKSLEAEIFSGTAAPPPYTPHPPSQSNRPLPTYDESQESGAVGFINPSYDGSVQVKMNMVCSEDDCSETVTENPYDSLENIRNAEMASQYDISDSSPEKMPSKINMDDGVIAEPIYSEPTPSNAVQSASVCKPAHDSSEPLYAYVPPPRPIEVIEKLNEISSEPAVTQSSSDVSCEIENELNTWQDESSM